MSIFISVYDGMLMMVSSKYNLFFNGYEAIMSIFMLLMSGMLMMVSLVLFIFVISLFIFGLRAGKLMQVSLYILFIKVLFISVVSANIKLHEAKFEVLIRFYPHMKLRIFENY